ncbi:MAG: ABC transporter ATP-binding protein [Planctomycetota bacterium]
MADGNGGPLFKVEGLKKTYQMGEVEVAALREIDLELPEGKFVVILGPSGSGKSTLLNIIGGIDTPTAGRVFYRGEDLSAYGERRLTRYRRNHVGFVFQFYNLIPNLTAEENVQMATQISDRPMDAAESLGLVGLEERRTHFPSQLSGGEQQRVAIARAVAKRPDVLFCDEPTGALDYPTGKVVLDVLQNVNRRTGTTVITITHNAAIAAMADLVVRLMDGRVRELTENEEPIAPSELEW